MTSTQNHPKLPAEVFYSQPLTEVCIHAGVLSGIASARWADPFEAYRSWRSARDAEQPPHLEFANLSRSDEDAKSFHERWGLLDDEDAEKGLKGEYLVQLGQFWQEQRKFATLVDLAVVLRTPRSSERLRILCERADLPLLRSLAPTSTDDAAPAVIQRMRITELRLRARQALAGALTPYLKNVRLTLTIPAQKTDRVGLQAILLCKSLREALAVMLCLDIGFVSSRRPLLSCRKCGRLFADAKQNVEFCSGKCAHQHSSLQSYHNRKRDGAKPSTNGAARPNSQRRR